MYKACLDRRKAQEKYILNLRYPDKSSDEYLEYLENRTDCNKGSDRDIMRVIEDVDIIRDVRNVKHSVQRTTLVVETDNDQLGFTRLRLVAGGDDENQNAAQVLPTPNITTETYNIHKLYHRHLLDGTKTDAVSGWLLYASFYYVAGQFDVTLRLTDYVLSRCLPDMVLTGCVYYNAESINNYRNHVHSTMTLNDKMRIATVRHVMYLQHSSLIPRELQLEVKDQVILMPPTVLCHCLRFLCYHLLGDISNTQQALHDLYLTVKCRNYILSHLFLFQ
ncbi:pepT [Mytilus coruscus]|uniref:PepT n=1 Tax=Mytilus coruscus TaxID=42192 RepID=A0A6J8BJD9_MYTCO|nr:pepT [Mytilus coruscus]